MEVKLFISAVSVEFEHFREPLRHALTRPDVSVKVQEDFKAAGVPTLIKLDDYIRTCDAVIHLVGDACGDDAPAGSVAALAERYADLADRIPSLTPYLLPGGPPLSYTQWEAWLALYHRRRLIVARAQTAAPSGPRFVRNEDYAARQLGHVEALKGCKVHVEIEFDTLDSLSAQLLGSPILDLLIDAALARRLAGDDAARDEFVLQEKRAGLPVPFFRHLWRELGSRIDLLGRLADAVRKDEIEALAASLAAVDAEAPEADLLRDAWRRVQRVREWEARLQALALPLSCWQDLAALVADTDARLPPRFSTMRELLLWAMDLGEQTRGLASLTQLLWLAAQAARLHAAPAPQPNAEAVVAGIEADDALKVHLPKAQAGPPPPSGPVRLYAELELAPGATAPLLRRWWVQHQNCLEPGPALPVAAPLGEQLAALASAVRHRGGRQLQVELLAPLLLLCAQCDWTSYAEDVGDFAGLEDTKLERDFCEDWPVSWRWRDRLEALPRARPEHWRERAALVAARATQCAQLVCRFADEPAAPETHLLGLPYVPPAPTQKQRNLKAFIDALVEGEPYMLWPSDENIGCNEFKAAVRQCIADTTIGQLPEVLRQARKAGLLRQAVLFIDEPGRNPYELMGRLSVPDAVPH